MNWQSINTRLMGSYAVLLVFFILQIPVIYWVISGLGEKYSQVDEAGSLRKSAVEITGLVNRHAMTGNGELGVELQAKRAGFGKKIEALRAGGGPVPPLKGHELAGKLDLLDREWREMAVSLDRAAEYGNRLREARTEAKGSTARMMEAIGSVAPALGAKAAEHRARTLRLSYLFRLYLSSHTEKEGLAADLKKEVSALDEAFGGFRALDGPWQGFKGVILAGVEADARYGGELAALQEKHTPQVVSAGNDLTNTIAEEAKSTALKGLAVIVLTALALVGLTAVFMLLAKKHVLAPVLEIKSTVEDFSKGDFTSRSGVSVSILGREVNDELASLSDSVNRMAAQVSGIVQKITDTSVHLASASEELAATSAQMSEGAQTQSGQTAHVATAMEEMSATVMEVAHNSQQASASAKKTKEIAAKGGQVVNEAISAMKEVAAATSVSAGTITKLGASSEEIGTIVSVINDIADQTNLLALNAAIEAARAGEQGRGFAVVADEVRKLAERTTRATKEISVMISSIQQETSKAVSAMNEGTVRVENGVKLANEAGQALADIVSGVEMVTDMIGQIATSAEQQSATTGEITRSMDSIAEVAKTNVTATGEVAMSTGELSELASVLKELVTRFKTSENAGGPAKAAHTKLRIVNNPSRKAMPANTAKA